MRDSWDARREALPVVLELPPPDEAGYLAQAVRFERLLAVTPDIGGARHLAELEFARGVDPLGKARQFAAMHASGERTPALASVRTPTLVVHGADDPLIGVRAAAATVAAIPGARSLILPGMGHYLARAHGGTFVDAVSALVAGVVGATG